MRTTVDISDPLFRQAEALAVRERLSFRDLVEEGLRLVLAARSDGATSSFRLRDGGFSGGEGPTGGRQVAGSGGVGL